MSTLRNYRTRARMSQAQLAALTGISVETIAAIEREGVARANTAQAYRLALVLGVTIEELIGMPSLTRQTTREVLF